MFPSYEEVMHGISESIEDVERQRSALAKRIKRLVLAGLVLALVSIATAGLFPDAQTVAVAFLFVTVILWVAALSVHGHQGGKLRLLFKEKVVGAISQELLRLCKLPDETDRHEYHCSYDHHLMVPDQYIHNSQLFDFQIDKKYGEDLFHGRIGLTDFMFSELTLMQIRISSNTKGQTSTSNVQMFNGILFVADFHKHFNGVTILRQPSGAIGKLFTPFTRLITGRRRISLENQAFNRMFEVRTTDDIKARYLLTSNMMERIMDFKKRHREKVEISFVNSLMCVALSTGKNYFEPKLFRPITGQTEAIYEDMLFFFGMVEDFDLNTRIWTKL